MMINLESLQSEIVEAPTSQDISRTLMAFVSDKLDLDESLLPNYLQGASAGVSIDRAEILITKGFLEEALMLYCVANLTKWSLETTRKVYKLSELTGQFKLTAETGDYLHRYGKLTDEEHLSYCATLLAVGRSDDAIRELSQNPLKEGNSAKYLNALLLATKDHRFYFDAVSSLITLHDKKFRKRFSQLLNLLKNDSRNVSNMSIWGDLYEYHPVEFHPRITDILGSLGLFQHIPVEKLASIPVEERPIWASQIRFELKHDRLTTQFALNSLLLKSGLSPVLVSGNIEDNILSSLTCPESNQATQSVDQPLVSVILCCFNSEKTLKYAIESILNQTYSNMEIIIVDDASDIPVAVLPEWHGREISLIRNETNAGPYVSRNVGLEHAKGTYVAFHDADDWAHPEKIQRQLKDIENTDFLAHYCKHLRVDSTGKLFLENNGCFVGDGPITGLFHKSIFELIGKFLPVRTRGDIEFKRRIMDVFGANVICNSDILSVFALEWNSNSKVNTDSLTKEVKLQRFMVRSRKLNYLSKIFPVDRAPGDFWEPLKS